jgi:predicted DsbA family dithiol-disulfide isomerase
VTDVSDTLTIDIVTDVVCPWCYLGKKRLEAALAEERQPVAVRWRPCQLDPTIPSGGLDRTEYMERKFGRDGRLKAIHDQLVRLGAEVGISFAFDEIRRAPNTLDAHRLIRWAASAGVQREVVERLFRAHFSEGRDVGDRPALLDIAVASGLDADIVERRLEEGVDAEAVRREISEAQAIGVTGVPYFIFARRIGVAGAQDVALLRRALAQARKAMSDASAA